MVYAVVFNKIIILRFIFEHFTSILMSSYRMGTHVLMTIDGGAVTLNCAKYLLLV